MPFPLTPLGTKIELFYNGRWNEVTPRSDVRGLGAADGDISIGFRGQPDESSNLSATIAHLSINNRNGKYSPRNTAGDLYGLINQNTPLRISTDIADTTSVIDLFATNGTNGWPTAASGHVWSSSGAPVAEFFTTVGEAVHRHNVVNTTHVSGLTSVVATDVDIYIRGVRVQALPTGGGVEVAFRARVNGTDNLNAEVIFNATNTISVRLTEATTGGVSATSFMPVAGLVATDTLDVRFRSVGRTIQLKAWKSSQNEPVAWSVTKSNLKHITPGFLQARSRLGAGVTNALPFDVFYGSYEANLGIILITGEIAELPKKWDTTGTDVWTPVVVSGITRRLMQGAKALRSPLYRAVTQSELLGYWSLEDLTGPTIPNFLTLPSDLTDVGSLTFTDLTPTTGFGKADAEWSADNSLVGSGALPTLSLGSDEGVLSYRNAPLRTPNSAHNSWTALFWHKVSLKNDTLNVYGSAGPYVRIANSDIIDSFNINVTQQDTAGSDDVAITIVAFTASLTAVFNAATTIPYRDDWRMIMLHVYQNGVNVTADVYVDNSLVLTASSPGNAICGQPYSLADLHMNASNSTVHNAAGHFAFSSGVGTDSLFSRRAFIYSAGYRGHAGETAVARMTRLCSEEGIYLEVTQATGETGTLVGPQRQLTITDSLAETARADDGVLYELRHELGYGFRTLASQYAVTPSITIDYQAAELGQVPFVTDDDRLIRNEVTVKRTASGTAYTATRVDGPLSINSPYASPAGVGRYDGEVPGGANLYDDTQLPDYAWWRVHQGTWDDSRWPSLTLYLHRAPFVGNLAHLTAAVFMDIADVMAIVNPPAWLGPDSVMQQMRATSFELSNFTWGLTWSLLPGGTVTELGRVGNTQYGRLDTTRSITLQAVSTSDTEFIVHTPEHDYFYETTPRWVEDIGDLFLFNTQGFHLRLNPPSRAGGLGGEQVRVWKPYSAVDTFNRVGTLIGSSLDTGQVWAMLSGPSTDITTTGVGVVFVHPAANSTRFAAFPLNSLDACFVVDVAFNFDIATAGLIRTSITFRTSSTEFYAVNLTAPADTAVLNVQLGKFGSSVFTFYPGIVTLTPTAVGKVWRIKGMLVNRSIFVKAWDASLGDAGEPEEWQLSAVDVLTEYQTNTDFGFRTNRNTANTNTNPAVTFSNLKVQTPLIRPAYYDRFNRTVVDGLGTATQGGAWTAIWTDGGIADFDVTPNAATTVLAAANGYRAAYLGSIALLDTRVSLVWTVPVTPTGAALEPGNIILRGTSITTYVLCRVTIDTGNALTLQIHDATGTLLASVGLSNYPHIPGNRYRTKAAVIGSRIMMKCWDTSMPEPFYWQLSVIDPATPVTGWVGFRNGRAAGNTNAAVTPTIEDFQVETPQTIKVERGTNGVTKAWPSNTDVRLWYPLRLGR